MNALKLALVGILFWAVPALAEPASEASVRELQAVEDKTPTPRQQQAITNFQNRVAGLMKDQLSWAKFEPMYLRLYQQTFTEEEVKTMLEFYKTPGGQALISKMPLLMDNLMREMASMLADVKPKMQSIQQDFAAEMKAAGE
jgi:hypothetical protein